jgi:hypothetical protein
VDRTGWLATRGGAFGAAGGIAVAGLVFALRGGGDAAPTEAPLPILELVEDTATPATSPLLSATATGTSTGTGAADSSPTPGDATTPAPASVTASPPTQPAVAAAQPRVTSTPVPPTAPAPFGPGDVPKYRDTEVLALAAGAHLPSGLTFKECVERPPSEEHWPVPVHLYYEGLGRWLIETHVSEIQVVFHEATATFTTRNFAPPNPGCR